MAPGGSGSDYLSCNHPFRSGVVRGGHGAPRIQVNGTRARRSRRFRGTGSSAARKPRFAEPDDVGDLLTYDAEEIGLRAARLRTRLSLTMKRRVRILAALLALATLSITFVESGWARGCDSSAAGSAAEHSAEQRGDHDAPGSSDSPGSSAPECRLAAPVGCASVFLPTPPIGRDAAPPREVSVAARPETTPDLLLVSPLLRPPRS